MAEGAVSWHQAGAASTPPLAEWPPVNAPPTWVEPEVVCRVTFASWTEAGLLRQASFLGLVDDLDPRDYHMRNIRERIDELCDLWRPVLGPGIDMERALDALTRLWEEKD